MRKAHVMFIISLVLTICTVAAFAALPQTISYQGYMKNSTTGVPVNATVPMTFSLYSSNPPRSDNYVWRETQPTVAVVNGIYSTRLGSESPITAPFDAPYWLGVNINNTGELPLQPLASVPYALNAARADNVNSSSQIITSVATGTPPLQVSSTTLVPNLNADMVDGLHASDILASSASSLTSAVTDLQSQITTLASARSAAWSSNIPVEQNEQGHAYDPQIVMLKAGSAQVVWRETDGSRDSIWSSRYSGPSRSWSAPELAETDNAGNASTPQIVSLDGNNSLAVWRQSDGTRDSIWANRFEFVTDLGTQGSGWGTPELIETNSGNTFSVSLASNGNGTAMAVWVQSDGTRNNVWTNRYVAGSGWGTAELIETDNTGDAGSQHVSMNASGDAIAVWRQSDGTRLNAWANRYTDGVGWGTPELIETDNSGDVLGPRVEMDGSGNAIAVWMANDGVRFNIWWNRYTAGSGWGTAALLETYDTASAYRPQIRMDAIGNALVIWDQYDGSTSEILSRRYMTGIGWGPVQTVQSGIPYSTSTRLALDANGNGVAVWYQDQEIWANNYQKQSGWAIARRIDTLNGTMTYPPPQPVVAMGDPDNVIAVWSKSSGGLVKSDIWAGHVISSDQVLTIRSFSGTNMTSITAPNATTANTLALPNASGTVITTGNLYDIAATGTVTSGVWNSLLGSNVVTNTAIANGAVSDVKISGTISAAKLDLSGTVAKTGDSMTGDLSMSGASINLPATTAAAGMIRQGGNRLIHTFGTQNFFAGTNAGNLTTSGISNTAIGTNALTAITNGIANTAAGNSALALNTGGSWNTASGNGALNVNISGNENTATGGLSLGTNTTGNYNTATGAGALQGNTTGNSNTATGRYTLQYNTTANNNTALGNQALNRQSFSNSGTPWDSWNTAVGANALYFNQPSSINDGINNSGLGAQALYNNSTGFNNTASGYMALYANTTGSGNTAIGSGADVTLSGLTNATAIGYNAKVGQSNSLVLGGTGANAVKVGIGTSLPSTTLDVVGDVNISGTLTAANQTFASAPSFSAASGAPFNVASSTMISNLNAEKVGGKTLAEISALIPADMAPLLVLNSGTGTGSISSSPAGVNCTTTCLNLFAKNGTVALTATPTGSSSFAGWSGACSGTGACNVTMDAAQNVTATFTNSTYNLNVTRTGGGTVASTPAGLYCGSSCTMPFSVGTAITLSATPDTGYTFAGWGGSCTGTGSCTVTMDAAKSVSARFTAPLSVVKTGTGTGVVTSSSGSINCGATCSAAHDGASLVTLTATPSGSSSFSGWSGACAGTGSCVVMMDAAKSVVASFTTNTVSLAVTRAGSGDGRITSSPAGIDCGAMCTGTYDINSAVTLTATPDATSTFAGWTGACTGTGTCSITMNASQSVTATFIPKNYNLSVSRTGAGSVVSSTGGIYCGAHCTGSILVGTPVTLTATPDSGATFTGWSGGCSGTGTCSVTMDAAKNITATFVTNTYTLTTTKAGIGSGTITSNPAGISCGSTCSSSLAYGTLVTLVATPDATSSFSGWSGACSGTNSCVTIMNSAQNVTATFMPQSYNLSVTRTGAGTVISSTGGIYCGAQCAGSILAGTSVTLSAIPDSGAAFTGWSGGGCSGTGTCTVTLNGATAVTASFTTPLSVALGGTGSGTVTSLPAGINCGAACTTSYPAGTAVTLTPTPASNSSFAGWLGSCSGTGTCNVTMSEARNATALFMRDPQPLLVSVTGTGSISSSPPGITCSAGACIANFDRGTSVTLTDSGGMLTSWSGACSGTGPCIVTMDSLKNVMATFTP